VKQASHESHLVFDRTSRALVGVINLNEIVRGSFQSAYLGYYAFEPHSGQGFMSAGMALVLQRAFRQLGLHRVEANIQPDNRIVVIFRHRDIAPWAPQDVFRFRFMVECSLYMLAFALLPFVVYHLNAPQRLVWASCSALLGAVGVGLSGQFGPYLAGLAWLLVISGVMFFRLLVVVERAGSSNP
jgi:hypothetical protein